MSRLHDADASVPSVDIVLSDPSTSWWLRTSLVSALKRDRVDAANDAEVLARILDAECRSLLQSCDKD
jgi:hypothetical protein